MKDDRPFVLPDQICPGCRMRHATASYACDPAAGVTATTVKVALEDPFLLGVVTTSAVGEPGRRRS